MKWEFGIGSGAAAAASVAAVLSARTNLTFFPRGALTFFGICEKITSEIR
jgi:hypothetical protein